MQDPDQLNEFLTEYEHYVREVLQPTHTEIKELFATWQNPAFWEKYRRSNRVPIPTPVRSLQSRIKRPEQVVDKIFRKPEGFPGGLTVDNLRRMYDAVGFRIIVYTLSHLILIDRELRSSEFLEISTVEPPMAYLPRNTVETLSLDHITHQEKESGYCSVHYCLKLRQSRVPPNQRPWFELQVRTLAQELWSTLEHHLGYKPGQRTNSAARRQFKLLSKQLNVIDEHFNFLYEELNQYQEEVTYDPDDNLDAENLPSVLWEVGIGCAQRDINNILKFLYSRGVERVRDVRQIATPKRLDIIRNTYLAVTGRSAASLEVVASLAALRGAADGEEEIRRIKAQIAYRGAWDAIRQELSEPGESA
jgi:putative GTP pyrophosphokinase